jgi:hypothetical protein
MDKIKTKIWSQLRTHKKRKYFLSISYENKNQFQSKNKIRAINTRQCWP